MSVLKCFLDEGGGGGGGDATRGELSGMFSISRETGGIEVIALVLVIGGVATDSLVPVEALARPPTCGTLELDKESDLFVGRIGSNREASVGLS